MIMTEQESKAKKPSGQKLQKPIQVVSSPIERKRNVNPRPKSEANSQTTQNNI
jgi:hypothetical protein